MKVLFYRRAYAFFSTHRRYRRMSRLLCHSSLQNTTKVISSADTPQNVSILQRRYGLRQGRSR